MLGEKAGVKRNEYVKSYVLFDLETTGISCQNDAVIEISAIKVLDEKVVEEFNTLVNPKRPIPKAASSVNGITDEMVAAAPEFKPVLLDFLTFIEDLPLVGHNIHTFDMKFIYRDCKEYFGKVPTNDYIDTLVLARMFLSNLSHHKLGGLAEYYGISTEGAHRALNDCRMNQKVYVHLGEEMKKNPNPSYRACPKCGELLTKRNGKFGAFWGCSGYPNCRFTENI